MVDMPSRVIEGDAPRIQDGLDYALPILLPDHQRKQLEAAGKLDDWLTEASLRDTYKLPFDSPGYRSGDNLNTLVTEDPLQELNQAARIQVWSSTHSAYHRNPIAKRATHYVSAFVVGDGFNLTCKNKEVEALLQAFIDSPDNPIREYERQWVIDLLVDGELFIRYFEQDGEVVAVPIRPWEIQYIRTEKGFFRRPQFYHLQPYNVENVDDPEAGQARNAEDIPAEQMLHVAINRHTYELRGRPELYTALPWLRAHKEWLENRARQNHWRGALLWWVKVASAVPGVIAAKLAQYQRPPTPGSTVVTSDKEEWTALNNPVGAGDAGEDGRQLKIMALNGLAGIPEYMTGDGANANLASTTSQQLPVLTTFQEFQSIMTERVLIPLFRRVLQTAIDAGLIAEEVEEQDADGEPVREDPPEDTATPTPTPNPMAQGANPSTPAQPKTPVKKIKTLEAFEVQYEPIGAHDVKTLSQALDLASNNGWISDQTATTELGFDYAVEQKRMKREQQQKMNEMAMGLTPMPPTMTPPGMQDNSTSAQNNADNGNPNNPQNQQVA